MIAVARTADMILMMLDSVKGEVQKRLLEHELESVGIRLNTPKPDIYFKQVRFVVLSKISNIYICRRKRAEFTSRTPCHSRRWTISSSTQSCTSTKSTTPRYHSETYLYMYLQVCFRNDYGMDDFIDIIMGNRAYLPCVRINLHTSGVL